MRLWSGTQIAYGKDGKGPAVIAMGVRIPCDIKDWELDLVKPDGTRIWRPVRAGEMERLHLPVPEELCDVLKNELGQLKEQGLHPAISGGLENEAERLYPESDSSVADQFGVLIDYLRQGFGLDEEKMKEQSSSHYVDGFGPDLLLMLDNKPILIPELPEVWLAPSDWLYATWRVTNGMSGPLTNEGIPPEQQLQFAGDFPDPDLSLEGLIYYQAARAMLAWAAWEKDKQARYVKAIVSIITKGHRPLKNRI
jgi:hypothetical protein